MTSWPGKEQIQFVNKQSLSGFKLTRETTYNKLVKKGKMKNYVRNIITIEEMQEDRALS